VPKTVLIAEDNGLNRQLFSDVLRNAGYHVLEVADGPAAVTAARAEMPALLLLDMDLPGLSGGQVARRLRAGEGQARLRIIAISAHSGPAIAREALASGCDASMTKPVRPDALVAAVAGCIGPADPTGGEG